MDCYPDSFGEAIERCDTLFGELNAEPEEQLKLISRRTNYMINSWFHNVKSLKRPAHLDNPLYMHPNDARSRNLGDGSEISVRNQYGEVNTTVALDESLREGTVAMTHGWGYQGSKMKTAAANRGSNANNLIPSGPNSYEKISNQAFMTGIPVDVSAL